MCSIESITLRTDRLVLRPPTEGDVHAIAKLCGDYEIARTTSSIPHPYTLEHAIDFIEFCRSERENGTATNFAITLANSGELLGMVGLIVDAPNERAELGYWIGVPSWNRGYATEAARVTVDYGFEKLNLQRIFAGYFAGNEASGAVQRKLGFEREGVQRRHIKRFGEAHDLEMYALLRERWQSRRDTMRCARSCTDRESIPTLSQRKSPRPTGTIPRAEEHMSHLETVANLFPNLLDIHDQTLRENVANVWIEAIQTGCDGKGWTTDELRAVPFTLLAGDIDLRYIEHLNSCCKQCIAIAGVLNEVFGNRIPINLDHLIAGSLLADVGKPLEFDKDADGKVIQGHFGKMLRHPFSGVALCYKHDIPPEVMHIVATHSHEGDKVQRSIESIIFHHADFVDFDIAKYLGSQSG